LQVLEVDSNYVPVANEKVKTYTYKAVQLHVSRSLSPYPRKKHAQHVTSFTGMYVSSSHWNLEFERSWLLLQKAPTNKIMIWAQSELPRRSWFIIKLWNSLL
jgi:hypothetical protein